MVICCPETDTKHVDLKFGDSKVIIGNNNVIREFSVVEQPCYEEHTIIEDDVFIMQGVHVSHDVRVNRKCVITNTSVLAGIVKILEGANIAMACTVNQYATIGQYSIVATNAACMKNVRPFSRYIPVSYTHLILALTIGRFQNWGKGPLASVYGYIGQQNLYFNKYGLDNGGIRYGDRTFPLFKQLLGFENVPKSFWERREKYHNLKINDEKFISFVGDFTLDFGPYIAPIIFVLLTLFVLRRTKIRNGEVAFHQLILLHLVMCICVQGGLKLYSFADTGNLQILSLIHI